MENLKQRHGCVSIWLWLIIIINVVYFFVYISKSFDLINYNRTLGYGLLSGLALVNVLGGILLMRWNKCGFYILIVNSLLAIGCNVGFLHISAVSSVPSLMAILIWWAILQIRKNGVSAWQLMDDGWDWAHCRHLYQVFFTVVAITVAITFYKANSIKNNDDNFADTETTTVDTDTNADNTDQNDDNAVKWKVFVSKGKECSIEAPDDFRNANLNKDQLIGVMCSDYDPAAIVISEPVASLKDMGVKTSQEYAQVILKANTNVDGATGYNKISEKAVGNAYLIVYEMTLDGTNYHYCLYATKSKANFYYCLAFCLKEYAGKLENKMEHMVTSLRTFK